MFSKFLRKLSPEMLGMGRALLTMAGGIALQSAERRQVEDAANQFITGAENIMAGIDSIKDMGLSPDELKKEVRAAVKETLPDIIGGLSEAALRKLLEDKVKAPK